MGRIPDEDVQRVRDATDVVALISESIVLKQKGRLYWGLCPFHGEKTPSLKADPATQLWHCFGCGAGGDAIGFLMRQEHCEFLDAVRALADRARIEIHEVGDATPRGHKERLIEACEAAADFYHKVLVSGRDENSETARAYLANRGFGIDVAREFQLGFAQGRGTLARHLHELGFTAEEIVESNLGLRTDRGDVRDRFFDRVMFPIRDLRGRTIAFGGRVLGEGEPKYLNTSETAVFQKSRNLYALDRAKNEIV
ncbi:MAG: CHC2 zinc finger domain-containing protein, partial [Coriobacteriia bacterium]|nr:CHC2 zinc finger domain-containing protein [Coriobacteriia bacterium]